MSRILGDVINWNPNLTSRPKVDCIFKENGELKTQVEERSWLKEIEQLKSWTKAMEEELVRAREDRNKAIAISEKFHNFIGHLGDVINKARLYDESMGQPGASPGSKIIWCMVNYSTKIEKLLKETCTLLQLAGQ